MRIVFMGSADVSCASLEALLACGRHEVVGVVTQPDRARGRRLEVQPCAVRERFGALGIPILTPANVNEPAELDRLRELRPEVIVVVAYGQILKAPLLALPPRGCVNAHYSLLPRYRGAAPIQWAIANGERVTGVTIMCMNERMDAGDILLQAEVPIAPDDTGGTLRARLAQEGARRLVEALDALADGRAVRRPQREELASYAPKLERADGRIAWTAPAAVIYDRVRAFDPSPGAWFEVPAGGAALVAVKALRVRAEEGGGEPGMVLDDGHREGPLVAAGQGAVRLLEVCPAGRRRMNGADFARGGAVRRGLRLP